MCKNTVSFEEPSDSSGIKQLKPFHECTNEMKRQRVQNLLQYSSEELLFVAQLKLYNEGKRTVANVVKEVIESPQAAEAIRKSTKLILPIKMKFVMIKFSKQNSNVTPLILSYQNLMQKFHNKALFTIQRLSSVQKDVLIQIVESDSIETLNLTAIHKCGYGKAVGFNSYKQKVQSTDDIFLIEISSVLLGNSS